MYMEVQTKYQVSVVFIEKSGWGNSKVDILRYFQYILSKQIYNLSELGHVQEQSLLYFYMASKLQHVSFHGNRLHFCKTKMSLKMLIMNMVVI